MKSSAWSAKTLIWITGKQHSTSYDGSNGNEKQQHDSFTSSIDGKFFHYFLVRLLSATEWKEQVYIPLEKRNKFDKLLSTSRREQKRCFKCFSGSENRWCLSGNIRRSTPSPSGSFPIKTSLHSIKHDESPIVLQSVKKIKSPVKSEDLTKANKSDELNFPRESILI